MQRVRVSTLFWIVSHASGVGRRSFARKAVADSNLVFAETICHIVHNCPSVLSIMRAGMCGKEGFFTLLVVHNAFQRVRRWMPYAEAGRLTHHFM